MSATVQRLPTPIVFVPSFVAEVDGSPQYERGEKSYWSLPQEIAKDGEGDLLHLRDKRTDYSFSAGNVRDEAETFPAFRDRTMNETPRSLLKRLRTEPDEQSWKCLVDLYTPLLRHWLQQAGVVGSDADDLMQEVFVAVVREIPSFEHNRRRGAFRCWLRTILVNRLRGYWNAKRTTRAFLHPDGEAAVLEILEDPASDLNQLWEREYDVYLAQRVLQLIEKDFTASTWHVFRRVVLDGAKPAEVAAETGLSVNAVLLANPRRRSWAGPARGWSDAGPPG